MRCGECREGFVSRNAGVKVENVHPADLLFPSSPALLQCTRFDLWETLGSFSFLPLQGAASPSPQCSRLSVLEALIGLSLPNCKDRVLRLSHHFQLLLCFTYSPGPQCVTRPHCYHALICNLNPKCCIFSFPHSTVSTQDSAVISRSTKYSSFFWPVSFSPASLPASQVISASVWTEVSLSDHQTYIAQRRVPPQACFESKDSRMSLCVWW